MNLKLTLIERRLDGNQVILITVRNKAGKLFNPPGVRFACAIQNSDVPTVYTVPGKDKPEGRCEFGALVCDGRTYLVWAEFNGETCSNILECPTAIEIKSEADKDMAACLKLGWHHMEFEVEADETDEAPPTSTCEEKLAKAKAALRKAADNITTNVAGIEEAAHSIQMFNNALIQTRDGIEALLDEIES